MQKSRIAPSNAGTLVIAAAAIIAGLWWFADLLTPLALAIFLWLTIDAFADSLKKRLPFLPRVAAIPLAVLIVFLSLAFIVGFIIEYATAFSRSLGTYQTRLNEVIAQGYTLLRLSGAPNYEPAGIRGDGDQLVDLVDRLVDRAELDDVDAVRRDEAAVGRAATRRQLGVDARLLANRALKQSVGNDGLVLKVQELP